MAGRRRNADRAAAAEAAGRALWERVVATVEPLPGRPKPPVIAATSACPPGGKLVQTPIAVPVAATAPRLPGPPTLDARWDRDLKRGAVVPERTIDLHDRTLADAHALVLRELDAARRDGLRVLLLVTGKARAEARTGGARGTIRASLADWLAASRHAGAVAAIRPAHPRHGGAGALYVILRRR